jgi:hypothetical protein
VVHHTLVFVNLGCSHAHTTTSVTIAVIPAHPRGVHNTKAQAPLTIIHGLVVVLAMLSRLAVFHPFALMGLNMLRLIVPSRDRGDDWTCTSLAIGPTNGGQLPGPHPRKAVGSRTFPSPDGAATIVTSKQIIVPISHRNEKTNPLMFPTQRYKLYFIE